MKCPRFSLGAIGFAILVLAINFAVVREALSGGGSNELEILVLLLLPMIDTLLMALYRLRRLERRTTKAVAFLIGGTVTTLVVLVSCAVAPEAAFGVLRAIDRPIAFGFINGLTRIFGNAAMQHWAIQLTVGITFELLFPIALVSFPPLVIALLGRCLAPQLRLVRRISGVEEELVASESVHGVV
jgi:hypothetical protein